MMRFANRTMLGALGLALIFTSTVAAQPYARQQPAGQQAAAPRQASPANPQVGAAPAAGNPFKLTPQEQAFLDQVLLAWEKRSDQVTTFSCPFVRFEYNAFSPVPTVHFSEATGKVSFQKPDKGSIQVESVKEWRAAPVPPGQAPAAGQPKGKHEENPEAIGEHWVCDGEKVYEFRHHVKEMHVTTIPPEMRGERIADGPLPFLFGAKADELKARYWFKVHPSKNPDVIHLVAKPKRRSDAANYRLVELMLDRKALLPRAMQVYYPSVKGAMHRDVYRFDLANASVNSRIDRMWNALFSAPRKPMGWKLVEVPYGGPAMQAATGGTRQR